MLSKIKSLFGALGGLVGKFDLIKQVLGLLGDLIKIGIANKDAAQIRVVCLKAREFFAAFRTLLDEMEEAFLALEAAVDESGPDGDDINFDEIQQIAAQAQDVGPVSADAWRKLDELKDELVKAVR